MTSAFFRSKSHFKDLVSLVAYCLPADSLAFTFWHVPIYFESCGFGLAIGTIGGGQFCEVQTSPNRSPRARHQFRLARTFWFVTPTRSTRIFGTF